MKALADGEARLRAAAALGLGLTRGGSAVAPLIDRRARENDVDVRMELLRALGRLGDPRAVPALAGRASAGGFFSRTPPRVRVEAARALSEIGGDAATPILHRHRNGEVRDAASKALAPATA